MGVGEGCPLPNEEGSGEGIVPPTEKILKNCLRMVHFAFILTHDKIV